MSYVPYPRGTCLIPSGPRGNHLFVIMTNACPGKMHLLVSVSSIRKKMKYDDACVFSGGEHPFIKGPSFVLYRTPLQRAVAHIQRCVGLGTFVVRDDMAEDPFGKMCEGFYKSKFIQPWALKYFDENCP
jgi:hypothetical protein